MKKFAPLICMILIGCAQTQAIRTSGDTLLIQTSAAPACGVQGSMKVAQKMAAVETIKAGYDKYIIMTGDAQNNVSAETLPGSWHTTGSMHGYTAGNNTFANYSGASYYQPGATIFHGTNDTMFHIKMFKNKQKGSSNAISAREILGSDWEKIVAEGVNTCTD